MLAADDNQRAATLLGIETIQSAARGLRNFASYRTGILL